MSPKPNPIDDHLQRILMDPEPSPFPPIFSVEITSRCNLKCPMCPQPNMKRAMEHMSLDTFRKVIDGTPVEGVELFLPQGMGESLLHPDWAEMFAYANDKGVGPLVLITNATLLTEKNVARMFDVGVDAVVLGMDGASQESYGEVRYPARLDKTEANVERLFTLRRERGLDRPRIYLKVIRMRQTDSEIERVRERWAPHFGPEDQFVASTVHTWSESVDDFRPEGQSALPPKPKGAVCRMLEKTLTVLQNGDVTPCCYDVEGEMVLGNVNDSSLESLWNGEKLANYRELHRAGRDAEIEVCRSCDGYVV